VIDRIARWLLSLLLARITTGTLTVIEAGERSVYGSGPPAATIEVRSPRMWRMALTGSRGLAEAYAQGLWDSPDLTALVRLAARNAAGLDRLRALIAPVRVPLQRARAVVRRSTRSRRRRDIAAHYDLGNELFSRMLDRTMSYSCAVFGAGATTLADAQVAKLELICDRLCLEPGDHLLEIGTGWGGLALHAAATRGCRVTTTTISREQHDHAVAEVRRAGLEQRVTVLLEDYRDLTGHYDKLVSIEMIEAVGWQHIGAFFAKCSDLLSADGAMLLQAITIDDRAYEVEKASRSFINTHIFPGGCLPSLEAIARNVARRTDMQMVALEDLTPHYVETLRRWQRNFGAHADELAGLGYDERFRRLWMLYLKYCEAGFAERRICDVQITLAKPRGRSAGMCRFGAVRLGGGRSTEERTMGVEGETSWPSEVSVRRMPSG
jgi:cyclopropane-fatty-acyl-phospholipid synthase